MLELFLPPGLFNNASLDEVLSAGLWTTENSFISHYLQSLSSHLCIVIKSYIFKVK
jgi:hypothetical protein